MLSSCHACALESLPRNPFHKRRFESQQTLSLLQKSRNLKQLQQIHAHILKTNIAHNQILITKLLSLYSSHKNLDSATLLFNHIQTPLTFTCNIMIRIHTRNGAPHDALLVYRLMLFRRIPPDKFTFPFVIKACSSLNSHAAVKSGRPVHAHAVKAGFSTDLFVQNTLMDLYLKHGVMDCGRKVFDKMRVRNVVSWTTVVSGLVVCGELEAARDVFEKMPVRNVVSWTAMINGYVRHGRPQEAFEVFHQMQVENVRPNEFTLVSLLLACTELGSLKLGSWIHEFAHKNGFELGVYLGTALIDMYSKCGSILDAMKVFDKMTSRSVATWNSMITGLGVHGRGNEAIALYSEMEKRNVRPDEVTFIGVLCACVNACMVDEGFEIFENMIKRYGIIPTLEHYRCMVELLRRAGMLDEVHELLKKMPMEADVNVWRAFLRACEAHGNIKFQEGTYKLIAELEPSIGGVGHSLGPRRHQCVEWEVG
ncbi:pentatricopeptide repeat-containing protein At3g26630, chloroplastic-like [Magnolia sinica]|uniref:pentatricopeptide repeat-containing protein At3g26630, chloroplastic-like n=1 Tax=Magnolia sinica TaxID=86752 RepID=UPI002658F882|nr:pentatricopeptide repeat-containing protein At3g26630, chloroplastic-like [Magnolia sinica]